jgi:hypothetical protein
MLGILILLAGLPLALAAQALLRRRGWLRRGAGAAAALLALACLVAGGYWTWFTHRGQPTPVTEQWARGIVYERIVLQSPRPLVLHLVRVDLHSGIEFLVTPITVSLDRPLKARTTSTFVRESGAEVAINASFFYPFRADSPFSYYPHESDPVQVAGIAAYQGLIYQPQPFDPPSDPAAILYISKDHRVSFTRPESIYHAVAGNGFLLQEGKSTVGSNPIDTLYPRTAAGLDQSESTLYLAVIDGKQPGYSEGVLLTEFADILQSRGIHTAINLDGGGSSTLVRQPPGGKPELISCPSNFRMPWWERPVANHLGIKTR